jgi:hypothetical protein
LRIRKIDDPTKLIEILTELGDPESPSVVFDRLPA